MPNSSDNLWDADFRLAPLVIENLGAPVVVVDSRGCLASANRDARALLQLGPASLPDTPIWQLIGCTHEAQGVRETIQTVLEGQSATTQTECIQDGSKRQARWHWSPLPGLPGGTGAVGLALLVVDQPCSDTDQPLADAQVRALLRLIPDLIFRMDNNGCFLEFYAAQQDMLYAPPDEIVGRSIRELLPEPVASESMDCLRRALASGTIQVHEYALPVAPGHRYFEARHIAMNHSDEVLAIVRDVTDRKLAEEALRESERQYRMLMDRASDAIFITDEHARCVHVNQQACRLLERTKPELVSMSIADLVPAEERHLVAQDFASLRVDEPTRFERRMCRRDGRPIDVEVSVTALPDGRVQAIVRDICERKRAEKALRRSEASFRLLIERTPDLILVHQQGKAVWVNDACARMFGVPAESLLGRSVLELVHPEDRQLVIDRMRRQQETGQAVPPVEERFVRADGSVWVGEVVAIPLEFQGKPSSIVIAHDLTARKRAEAERCALEARIQHTQKLESLGVLAGGIAHDFNNLLMGVLGNASLALLDLAPESPARESVKRIETTAHRAADLTKQLLAYSGRGRFVVQPLDLSKLVEEMIHLLETVISKKATLRLDFARDLPAIEADATQIRQVVMNLITNASDALGDDGGMIVVRTGSMAADEAYLRTTYLDEALEAGRYVFMEVSDTGHGMDADTVQRVFDPFFSTKFTGRGLGLAAVIGIVRGHRGAIKVYSEPGRGTCFKVLFPAVPAPTPSSAPEAEGGAQWESSGTVLVVDDEETVRSVARVVLERHGFEVVTANDGAEALDVFDARAGGVELIILDMTMPRMGGEETFREVRKRDSAVRVLLSSGFNEQEAIHRFAGRGLAGFIQKPYTPAELIERVRAILGT
ncbi:MAG: PAS domain S-box protein [Myxococcota bacterium]